MEKRNMIVGARPIIGVRCRHAIRRAVLKSTGPKSISC